MEKPKRKCQKAIREFHCLNTTEQLKIRPELIPDDIMDAFIRMLYNSLAESMSDPQKRADYEAYCAEHPDE